MRQSCIIKNTANLHHDDAACPIYTLYLSLLDPSHSLIYLLLKMTMNSIPLRIGLLVCLVFALCPAPCAGRLRHRRLHALGHAKHRVNDDRCRQFKTITQNVDHFGFVNMDKYEQRYTLNVDQWQSGKPIFFYAGNEGDIDLFCDNTGFSRCLAELEMFVVSSSSF